MKNETVQIQIVEDKFLIARIVKNTLERLGYGITNIAGSGKEALEQIEAKKPDLVLMDIVLKGDMDGIETAEKLREKSDVPIIYVTAYSDRRTLERAKKTSPYGYLTKPIRERELHSTIEMALRKYELDRELAEYRDHLEKLVHERTAELERATEVAEAGNLAKSQFMSVMSHELLTPLSAIVGMQNLVIRMGDLDDKKSNYLNMAHTAANDLVSMIKDILNFVSIDSQNTPLKIVEFDLRQTVKNSIEKFRGKAEHKGLGFTHSIAEEISSNMRGDANKIGQILDNLLSNAVKFTDVGQIDLRVKLERQTEIGKEIRFEVEDSGIGIPTDRADRLFEIFSKVDASMTRRFGGVGLGLAIAKKLCDLMGGMIEVKSKEGLGSTFSFTVTFEKC